ncbi:MAG: ferrous iron transport protein A [Candidatus Brocadia sp.]|nr:ferrous iron transport protein A [Candidatus Brocadia sp.]
MNRKEVMFFNHGNKRLTDLKPGDSGKVTDMEGGCEAQRRFNELGLTEGTEVTLKAYPHYGKQYVRRQGTKIVTEDIKELLSLLPAEHGKCNKFDREWIKEGNEIEIMRRLDPESVTFMVMNDGKSHVLGAGLTEKIFVVKAL